MLLQQALSLILSWFLRVRKFQVKLLKKKFIFNGLEEPSNKLFAVKYDNYNINYSGKSAKIVQNSNYDSNSSPRFG